MIQKLSAWGSSVENCQKKDIETLKGIVTLLEDYGRAVGYDPSRAEPVALPSRPRKTIAS